MRSHRPLLPLLLCATVALPLSVANAAQSDAQQSQQPQQQSHQESRQQSQQQASSATQNPSGQPDTEPTLQQAQDAANRELVPLRDEPHHQLVMQNDTVRVYTVGVPPNDATANHRHDHPYLAINFGAANIENDVQGKPPAHLQLSDGQLVYSPGGFAHVAKTSGAPFHNVTIELLKPQENAKNLCKRIIDGPLSCPQDEEAHKSATEMADARKRLPASTSRRKNSQASASSANAASAKSGTPASADSDDNVPYFETDEVQANVVTVSAGRDYVEKSPKFPALLVAMSNSNLSAELGGDYHGSFLHSGDLLWMPAGTDRHVTDFLGTRSNFLLVTFKDPGSSAPPTQ
jgi:hypothetical protein